MERLVGGLEVVRELHEQGKLKQLLEYVPTKNSDSIGARFKNRFKSSKNMVNVQGIAASPDQQTPGLAATSNNDSDEQ